MKVSGATGESPISGHEQESEVIDFHWGVSHPASVQSGTGGSAGRTTFTDFTCVCHLDNAYPSIVKFCAGGKAIDEVEGNPGYYTSKFFLRPHYQLEGLTVSLRLVSKLPSVKATAK
jgi:hypothetical protein